MKMMNPCIPLAALVALSSARAEDGTAPNNQAPPVQTEAKAPAEIEVSALRHLLEEHGGRMTAVEKSALTSAISRLEGEIEQAAPAVLKDLGVAAVPLESAMRHHLQPQIDGGLRVTGVEAEGLLSFWGVGKSDLIVAANGKSLHNAKELMETLDGSVESGKSVLLDVIVQGNRRTINLRPMPKARKLAPGAGRFWQFRGC